MTQSGSQCNSSLLRVGIRQGMSFLLIALVLLAATAATATTTTLVPFGYTTTAGTDGGEAVATSIDLLDETGTASNFNKYLELTGLYAGYRSYTLSTTIAPSSVTALQVQVNYRGPAKAGQTWTWKIFNWSTSSYVTIGDNAAAPSWGAWMLLSFNVTGTLANYVRTSDGRMQVQVVSNNSSDSADLDYEAIVATYSAGVSVSISPTSASVQTGNTQQFTATVTGSSNTAVNWQVNNIAGGNTTVGTVSASGLYTAPATVPSPAAVTVKAISQADTTKSASATVTVTAPPVVSVSLSPTSATLSAGGTQQFTATVTGTSNTAVTWSLTGVGTLSTSGVYTAPASVASQTTATVKATSQADTTKSASATVTINPAASLAITTTSPLPSGQVGTSYSKAFAASGGTAPNTWAITSGSVPGLLLSSAGVLSGTPTTANTYTITVQATDSTTPTHQTASGNFSLTISAVSGANYYVAPAASGGSDSNAGTLSSPWLTITHAILSGGPGVTINVRQGTYNERVVINKSGSAAGGNFTLQNYNGEAAIIDGTGIAVASGGYAYGLVDVTSQSYFKVSGFDIRNFKTSSSAVVPAGIHVEGSGTNIQLLNNHIHGIYNTGSSPKHDGSCPSGSPNGFGLIVAGTSGTSPIDNLTISGNELNDLQTGCSESMTTNGNTQHFTITNNLVHDNNNIGIAALGGEGVAASNDLANHGTINGNSIYNITSNGNTVYGNSCTCADGIYADGSNDVIIERNLIHNVDWGIETTGEKAGQNTTNVTIRSNLIYSNNAAGLGIGGQGNPGGASNITVVNNTFYNNDTASQGNGTVSIGASVTGSVIFKNNIAYASASGLITGQTGTAGLSFDYNVYFNGTSPFTEAHSLNANPQFVSTASPDLHVAAGSPAVNAGTNLGSTVVGTLDCAGNARVQGANIDIGAYEQ